MFMLRSAFVLPLRASRIISLNALNCNGIAMGNVLGRQMSTEPPKLTKRILVEPLKERKVIRVHGEEVVPFLQGLISNDMNHLQVGQASIGAPSIYALFLNKSGRILYDSIIYKTTDPKTYLIECDKTVVQDLTKHLLLYRVRRNIQIDEFNDYQSWVAYDSEGDSIINRVNRSKLSPNTLFTTDPRLTELGLRLLMPTDIKWPEVARLFHVDEDSKASVALKNYTYRKHRYRHGVGEGITDLPPGKAFPLEANCDYLHGISFHKGCYIGQELTARVHHTGVVRKRLMPIKLSFPITQLLFDNDPVLISTEGGVSVGPLRGSCGEYALGLIRIQQALNRKLIVDGQACNVYKPNWWPMEAPKKVPLREVA